jgi:hypothetical protein
MAVAQSAEPSPGSLRKLSFVPPCPPLMAAAHRLHIPTEGMSAWSGSNILRAGDSATVLITFFQKRKQTQWFLHLEAGAPPVTNRPVTFTVNSAFGPMKFQSRPYPVKMRMIGPFTATSTGTALDGETRAQFTINEDFLGLGLEEPAALLHRWSRITNFNSRVTSKALLALNPTPAEQRALSATFPALISYFNIIEHTEGLETLLRQLIDLPSLWSMIKHRGVQMTLTFGDGGLPWPANPVDWRLEKSAPAYYFPWTMRLNDEPALKITLVTTTPRPPLRICGGVAGVLAEKIGDENTYMTFRVVSAISHGERRD